VTTPLSCVPSAGTLEQPGPCQEGLQLEKLVVRYPRFTLGPLSLALSAGERVALLGANGSGKSSMLRALGGRLAAYEGSITLDGCELRESIPDIRARIGVLGESVPAYQTMSIREYLRFVGRFFPTWDVRWMAELLERFRVDLALSMGSLSKGTRVKVGLIAALAHRPSLLLLDEPTSGIDPSVRDELIEAIREASGPLTRRAVIYSTHILEDVEHMADRVLVLAHGALEVDAPLRDFRPTGASLSRTLAQLVRRKGSHES